MQHYWFALCHSIDSARRLKKSGVLCWLCPTGTEWLKIEVMKGEKKVEGQQWILREERKYEEKAEKWILKLPM